MKVQATFNPKIKSYILWYGVLLLLISILGIPFIPIWLLGPGQYISSKYYSNLICTLTEEHLIFKKGTLFKIEKTIPLENIQDLAFQQNPITNLFGLQVLKIETAGNSSSSSSDMTLIGIEGMERFRDKVLAQRSALKLETSNKSGNHTSLSETNSIQSLLSEIKIVLEQIRDQKKV